MIIYLSAQLSDSENSKITWKAVGDNIASVAIYKYTANKALTLVTNTTGKEYAYTEEAAYIVCPVLKDGTELEGTVLTVPNNISLAVSKSGPRVSTTVTNNGGSYLRAKVLVEAYIDGKVASYGYARTFITPNGAHKIDILLPLVDDVDSVKVTVTDDVNNVLAEATD